MTDTQTPVLDWDKVTPVFKQALKPPKLPPRPPDGAIRMAQKSYDGFTADDGETVQHVMSHRFGTEALAEQAAAELRNAGAYTTPVTTVTVHVDEADKRVVSWRAGEKRGRKS